MINKIPIDKTDAIKRALDADIGLTYKEKFTLVSHVIAEIKEELGVEYSNYVISHYRLGRLGFRMERVGR